MRFPPPVLAGEKNIQRIGKQMAYNQAIDFLNI